MSETVEPTVVNEIANDGYKQFLDDLKELVRPPLDMRDFASLLGYIGGLKKAADEHQKLIEAIALMIEVKEHTADGVKTALHDLTSEEFEVRRKRLVQYCKADLLSTLVYKIFGRK